MSIQTTECYSALKGNESSSHEKMWKNTEHISLSEGSRCEETTHYMIPGLYEHDTLDYVTFWKRQNYENGKMSTGSQGLEGREGWTDGGILGQ